MSVFTIPVEVEQKTGRIDRVGSLADRLSLNTDVGYPYIRHTQDEKAHKVFMARKSWFNSIMGERYESKWSPEDLETDTIFPLPEVSKA